MLIIWPSSGACCATTLASRNPSGGNACLAMGRELAAVALAIVSTKEAEHFRTSQGGYFPRHAKAIAGERHLDRTVWALRRAIAPETPGGQGRGPHCP